MRLLVAAFALCALGCSAQSSDAKSTAQQAAEPETAHEPGSFPLSYKNWSATLTSEEGIDTRRAVITGRVLEGDAREYCTRDPGGVTVAFGGRLTVEQCVEQLVTEEQATLFTASADCLDKSISSTNGRYTLVGFDRQFFEPLWRSEADGEVLDGSGASGASTVSAQFAVLCPSVSRAWRQRN